MSQGTPRRWLLALLCLVLVLPVLLAAATILLPKLRERQVYTDAQTIRQLRDQAAIRDVLWEPPRLMIMPLGGGQDDGEPQLTADGQGLFFVRGQPGAGADIWFARRTPEGWADPEELAAVSSRYDDLGPVPAPDGRVLFFYSDRPGGEGGYDLWMSRLGPAGWEEPLNLGPQINSRFSDYAPAPAPQGGGLYFASDRPRPSAAEQGQANEPDAMAVSARPQPRDYDLYVTDLAAEPPSAARAVAELNTPFDEVTPAVSPLGDFLYFASNRSGGSGGYDLYRARRMPETHQPAVPLGSEVNSAAHELDPSLDQAGFGLCFSSNRPASANPQAGPRYQQYYSRSREVFLDIERMPFEVGWAALWRRLLPGLVGALLAVAGILLLIMLMQRARSGPLALLTRCLLASVLVHLVALMLLSFWDVGSALADNWRQGRRYQVTLASPARDTLADQVRGGWGAPELPAFQPGEVKRDDSVPPGHTTVELWQSSAPALQLPASQPSLTAVSLTDSGLPPAAAAVQEELQLASQLSSFDPRLPLSPGHRVPESAPTVPMPAVELRQHAPGTAADEAPTYDGVQFAPAVLPERQAAAPGLAHDQRPPESAAALQAGRGRELPVRDSSAPALELRPLEEQARASQPEPDLVAPDPLAAAREPAPGSDVLRVEPILLAAVVTGVEFSAHRPAADATLASQVPVDDRALPRAGFDRPPVFVQPSSSLTPLRLTLPSAPQAGSRSAAEADAPASRTPAEMTAGPVAVVPGAAPLVAAAVLPPAQSPDEARGTLALSSAPGESHWRPEPPARLRPAGGLQPLRLNLPALEERSLAEEVGETPSMASSSAGRVRLGARRAEVAAGTASAVTSVALAPQGVRQQPVASLAAPLPPREAAAGVPAPQSTVLVPRSAISRVELPALEEAQMTPADIDDDGQQLYSAAVSGPGFLQQPLDVQRLENPARMLAPEQILLHEASLASVTVPGRERDLPSLTPFAAARPTDLPQPAPPEMRLPEETVPPDNPLAGRAPEVRKELITRMGGSDETEAAVARALDWLARHQSPDGRWDSDEYDERCGRCGSSTHVEADIALTGLALLSFFAADHTHFKGGSYQPQLERAVHWLLGQQREDGDLRGGETMYSHGIATIALAEGLIMTRDERLQQPVRSAVSFINAARNLDTGGWRYDPGQPGDTSVVGWQIMALKSAERAGMQIPEEAYESGRRWLQRVAEQPGSGLYAYRPGRRPTPAMTAEAMYALQLLGARRDEPRMRSSAAYLTQNLPDWEGQSNTYYWYYATLSLYQHQGRAWRRWNEVMKRELLENQERDGGTAGSWPPVDRWAAVGGRVYQTALCALMLESYYRYLPMYATEDESQR